MRVLDLLRRRPIAAACIGGILVGMTVGMFLPIRAPQPPREEKATWGLPDAKALKRFSNEQYQSVRSARFWGELALPGQRREAKSAWALAGIVTTPALRVAITEAGKQEVSWLKPGDTLPDGAILLAANRDAVWFEADGCRRSRKLYEKPAAETEACDGSPAAATPSKAPGASASATPPARETQ